MFVARLDPHRHTDTRCCHGVKQSKIIAMSSHFFLLLNVVLSLIIKIIQMLNWHFCENVQCCTVFFLQVVFRVSNHASSSLKQTEWYLELASSLQQDTSTLTHTNTYSWTACLHFRNKYKASQMSFRSIYPPTRAQKTVFFSVFGIGLPPL